MGRPSAPTITKSRFLIGRQCLKYLWIKVHEPDRIPPEDEAARHRFTEGYLIDRLAKSLYPAGIDVPSEDFLANIEQTQARLAERRPLFEAGFRAGDLSGRADILLPARAGAWDMIEVKSSTAVKDVHVEDVAFQRHCYQAAGLPLRKTFLLHIDNSYVRRGAIDPGRLLVKEDITDPARAAEAAVTEDLAAIRRTLAAAGCPNVAIGPQCTSPYECPLRYYCWAYLPEHDIFSLYFGGVKAQELFLNGVLGIKDIPAGIPLTERQNIQVRCVKSGRPHLDVPGLAGFLSTLVYPLSFLDFETFATAVPQFDNVKPYQAVPFQFSLHVVDAPQAAPAHRSFLARGPADPRPGFLKALKTALPAAGSVIVYNQNFEKSILAALAGIFPRQAGWIESVIGRLADLLVPFRAFHYYHPDQRGSASLKAVLPALTGRSYEDMRISDGLAASREYIYMTFGDQYGRTVNEDEKAAIRRDLLAYCGLDTEAMIRILEELAQVVQSSSGFEAKPGK